MTKASGLAAAVAGTALLFGLTLAGAAAPAALGRGAAVPVAYVIPYLVAPDAPRECIAGVPVAVNAACLDLLPGATSLVASSWDAVSDSSAWVQITFLPGSGGVAWCTTSGFPADSYVATTIPPGTTQLRISFPRAVPAESPCAVATAGEIALTVS